MARSRLPTEFLGSLPTEERRAWHGMVGLGSTLESLWLRAQTAWPGLDVGYEEFVGYLGARAPKVANLEALETLYIEDLYLACACSGLEERALRAFENHCSQEWEHGISRLSLAPSEAGEVKQALSARLFVASKVGDEHIRKYSGKGSIRAWYRTTAVRAAIDHIRANDRRQRVTELDDLDNHVGFVDLELDYLKRNYREEFKHAFQAALRSLTSDERNLLRYQLLERLTLEEIGRLYSLHLTSIARRLQRVRQRLLVATRENLQRQLGVDDGELDSIMRLIGSRLDVSISAVLGGQTH